MKKIITILSILCFFICSGHAQLMYPEVYSSFGGHTETGTFQLTFTSGEPLFETFVAEESILTQGFNQVVQVIEEVTFVEEISVCPKYLICSCIVNFKGIRELVSLGSALCFTRARDIFGLCMLLFKAGQASRKF